MSRWAQRLSEKQMALARAFQGAGLTTISQAVKAFERHDDVQIEAWKRALKEKRHAK